MIPDWSTSSVLGAVKPVLAALVLPPTLGILLALAGAWVGRRRPRTGRVLVVLACVGLWLGACTGAARRVESAWLDEPAPLNPAQRDELKARAATAGPLAIVVLGAGMEGVAPEYGRANLSAASFARLRYGLWLGRETGIAVAASGGRGWASQDAAVPAEATRMAEIARAEFGLPLHWVEASSRDTRENAVDTLALLRADGVREIVLVTHAAHMPRALREFRAAATAASASASASAPVRITPAAMGQAYPAVSGLLAWLPSGEGLLRMHAALHEVPGALVERP